MWLFCIFNILYSETKSQIVRAILDDIFCTLIYLNNVYKHQCVFRYTYMTLYMYSITLQSCTFEQEGEVICKLSVTLFVVAASI